MLNNIIIKHLNQNKMKKLFKMIADLFKAKCPNCGTKMNTDEEFFGSQVYSCINCKTQWF